MTEPTWKTKNCVVCGAAFVAPNRRRVTCGAGECKAEHSKRVTAAWQKRKYQTDDRHRMKLIESRRKEKIRKNCVVCSAEFLTPRKKQVTCGSEQCMRQHQLNLYRENGKRPEVKDRKNARRIERYWTEQEYKNRVNSQKNKRHERERVVIALNPHDAEINRRRTRRIERHRQRMESDPQYAARVRETQRQYAAAKRYAVRHFSVKELEAAKTRERERSRKRRAARKLQQTNQQGKEPNNV